MAFVATHPQTQDPPHAHGRVAAALVASVLLAGNTSCGDPCDRSGCEAVEHPYKSWSITTGIGGAVSSQSDVIANGCNECPLSQGHLVVWSVDQPVTSAADAMSITMMRPPDASFSVDETYEHALAPGHHLACIGPEPRVCAALSLDEGDRVTLHLRFVFGPPGLIVFEPDSDSPRTEGIFVISQ